LDSVLPAIDIFANGHVDLDFLRADTRAAVKRSHYITSTVWHQRINNLDAVWEAFFSRFDLELRHARITDIIPTVNSTCMQPQGHRQAKGLLSPSLPSRFPTVSSPAAG
jgi:hypothetical protein